MKKIFLACALSLFTAGCSHSVQTPALHDFGATTTPIQNVHGPSPTEITVKAPKWLNDNRIRYRLLYDEPTRVRFYTLDLWIAPPPELLKQRLAAAPLSARYSLDIELTNFEQQFDTLGSASVVLRFSATAYSAGDKNKRDQRKFAIRSTKVAPNAKGAVNGFAALADQASRQIAIWLDNLMNP